LEERLKAKGEEERGNVSIKRSIIQQEKTIKELERELGKPKRISRSWRKGILKNQTKSHKGIIWRRL
jgi:hypothetical protein